MQPRYFAPFVLGALAVSLAPVFIVLSGMSPSAIAVYRLAGTALLFLPFAAPRLKRDLAGLTGRQRLALVAGGVTYGLHFVLFNSGFVLTSYESTVVLLGAQPLLAALLGLMFLREAVTRRMLVAMAIALAGLVVIVASDYRFDPGQLGGDVVVVLGGLAIVVTYTLARRLRHRMGFASYVVTLSAVGALTSGAYLALSGEDPSPASDATGIVALVGLIVICTCVGHSVFNWVVKHVAVFYINLVILLEAVLSLLYKAMLSGAFPQFQKETLQPHHLVGGAILFVGVAAGLSGARRTSTEAIASDKADTDSDTDTKAAERDSTDRAATASAPATPPPPPT